MHADFNWIEDNFSPWPIENMRVSGQDLRCLYPIPRVDFIGLATGMEWEHYRRQRRFSLPEIIVPLASLDCHTPEESEKYEAARNAWLKEIKPEIRHRFLVAFVFSSGHISCSWFEQLQKLAMDGEFRFAKLWEIVDPMQLPGFAEELKRQRECEKTRGKA